MHFSILEAPKVEQTPNFYFWYAVISGFNVEVVKSWANAPAAAEKKAAEPKKADAKPAAKKVNGILNKGR